MKEARRHPPLQVSQAQVRPGKSWPEADRRGPYGTYTWDELPLPCFTRPQHFLCGEYCPFFLGVSQPGKMGLLSLEPHSLTPVAPEVL